MGSKIKSKIVTHTHNSISDLKTTVNQHKTENPGFIKKFLNWIARGTKRSGMSIASCPT